MDEFSASHQVHMKAEHRKHFTIYKKYSKIINN